MSYVLSIITKLNELASDDGYLRTAVRSSAGRVFKGHQGERHVDLARRKMSLDDVIDFHSKLQKGVDKDIGFVDHHGHYLDRNKAGEYAKEYNLIDPKLKKQIRGYDSASVGLVSDVLKYRKFG
jgi:hypothetical protein